MYIALEEGDGFWPCCFSTRLDLGDGTGRLKHIGGDIRTQHVRQQPASAGRWQKSEIPDFWGRTGQSGRQQGAHLWPPILGTTETNHSMRLSPSPLRELARFEPKLPCNEFHVMSFKSNAKTCDFPPEEKIKDAYGGSCYYWYIWGLCLHDNEKDDDYCRH